MSRVADVRQALQGHVDPEKAAFFPRFFKTGPGEYGEGDRFLGVTVPNMRKVAKTYGDLTLDEIGQLLDSPWHEERFTGLAILVAQYQKGDDGAKQRAYDFYMAHTARVNNWDLVDSTAEFIVGPYLDGRPEQMDALRRLAASELVWERRIAMLATFAYIKQGRADEALQIIDLLIDDQHDLMRKAVGWMLREIGKRVDRQLLLEYLDRHAATMPRTTLRYALEHLDEAQKRHYMGLAKA
jgi:3-methyladenine DNA glycosylase AlkD